MAGVSPALQRGTSSSSTLPRTGGAAGFRRYLPRVALSSCLVPAGLSPPFACWAFSLEETPQEAAGSFTGRDLKAEQLDRAGRIVPQGSWSWQAVVLIIADAGQDSVRIWLETGSNFPPDAQASATVGVAVDSGQAMAQPSAGAPSVTAHHRSQPNTSRTGRTTS